MKRKLLIVLTLILALSITACSNKDEEKPVGETETTPVEDTQTPDEEQELETPVETPKEEEVAVEDTAEEDAIEANVSDKWPENFMEKAPKLEGEIDLIKEEGPNKYFMKFKDINYDDANEYIKNIKEAGFTENSNEYLDTDSLKYKGMDSENNLMIFHWSKDERAELTLVKKNN